MDYEIDKLGWYQFERMCQALLKDRLGPAVESWGGNADRGADAYCHTALHYPENEILREGPFVFQVKFVAEANARSSDYRTPIMSAVGAEIKRIRERIEQDEWISPKVYTLITNAPLSADDRTEIRDKIEDAVGGVEAVVQGASDVFGLLDNASSVRLSYPQILGLRDFESILDRIVHGESRNRSELALEQAIELSRVFVRTKAYRKAVSVVEQHSFVVLTGPPEMGKTSIARIIGLARHAEDWEFIQVSGPSDLLALYKRGERQVFIADDAFGTTEYDPNITSEWAKDLEHVLRIRDSRHWLLLTSRPAPLREALAKLALSDRGNEFPDPGQVLVNSNSLEFEEKAQILYRHAKENVENSEAKSVVREVARAVVGHRNFTPLRVERFVKLQLPLLLGVSDESQADRLNEALEASLTEPTSGMKLSYEALADDAKALLSAMLEMGGGFVELRALENAYKMHSQDGSRPLLEVITSIDDHFVSRSTFNQRSNYVSWVHPSVRDLVIEEIISGEATRREFLLRSGTRGVMLALSVGGGESGRRKLPLLQSQGDWLALLDRISDLISDGDRYQVHQMLVLGVDALRVAQSDQVVKSRAMELKGVARHIAERALARWRTSGETFSGADLSSFFQLSTLGSVPLECPDLGASWESVRDDLVSALELESNGEAVVEAARRFEYFLLVVAANEPRWLGLLISESDLSRLRGEVAESVRETADSLGEPAVFDEDDPEEYEEEPPEMEWFDDAEVLLSSSAFEAVSDREPALMAMEDRADAWAQYKERYEGLESEPDEDVDRDLTSEDRSDPFDIDRVFEDL